MWNIENFSFLLFCTFNNCHCHCSLDSGGEHAIKCAILISHGDMRELFLFYIFDYKHANAQAECGERKLDKIIIQITLECESSAAVVVGTLNRKNVIRLLFKLCQSEHYIFLYICVFLSAIQFKCFRTFFAYFVGFS